MKRKPKSMKSLVLLAVVIVAAAVGMNALGLGTQRSGVRLGYVEHAGWRGWSASYAMFNGWARHTIRPASGTLYVDVTTTSGTLAIEMKDAGGNPVFSAEDVATSSFEVEVPGKVVVSIEADHHAGSFDIR